MERFLCAWSPTWAIASWRRRNPSASSAESPASPFALIVAERGVRRLAHLDPAAAEAGLRPGQSVADACAKVPELITADADPAADRADLVTLADWCARLSPGVALDPPDGLIMDIGGLAHLWGGEGPLMDDVAERLARQGGVEARLAIASTPGAAWALAHFGPDRTCVAPGEEAAALAPLPVAGLRCPAPIAAQLGRLGLETIGALMGLPRAALSRRFGGEALLRLDQALGRAPEALSYRRPPQPWFARLAFAEPISAPEDMARASADVAALLCTQLEARGQGARGFELAFHGVDGRPRRLEARLAAAARDPVRLARLFAPKLETVDPGFGIEVATMTATGAEPLGARQGRLDPDPRAQSPETLAPLIDRLVNRLGERAVWRAEPYPSHLPERSSVRRPPLAPTPAAAGDLGRDAWRPGPRPLRLLKRPEPVEATAPAPDDPPLLFRWRGALHRVRRAEGPERISPEWWRAPFEAAGTPARDYYRVEDEAGARFWLFRDGPYGGEAPPRWWLHGLFG
jgi:protein ImuB